MFLFVCCEVQHNMLINRASSCFDCHLPHWDFLLVFFLFILLPLALAAQMYQTGRWHQTRRKPGGSRRWGNRCWGNTPSWKSLLKNRTSLRWERSHFKQRERWLQLKLVFSMQSQKYTNYLSCCLVWKNRHISNFSISGEDVLHMHPLKQPLHVCFCRVVAVSRLDLDATAIMWRSPCISFPMQSPDVNNGWISFSFSEHSGQADQKDQPGTGGGNKLVERPVHGGHHSQRRYCKHNPGSFALTVCLLSHALSYCVDSMWYSIPAIPKLKTDTALFVTGKSSQSNNVALLLASCFPQCHPDVQVVVDKWRTYHLETHFSATPDKK